MRPPLSAPPGLARAPALAGAWPEAVFHVLAHVRATAHLAASAHDAAWIAEAAAALGPAEGRALAEDAALLGRLLPTHAALAAAQGLAWLFRTAERAEAAADRDLGALGPGDVDAPELLAGLSRRGPAVEVLRAAAELELPCVARFPPPRFDPAALAGALRAVARAAPRLAESVVRVVRPLGSRGRVRGREVWVGAAAVDHMAWQAAHESTVAEVAEELAARREGARHEALEAEAIARMAARARAAGLAAEHAAWLAHSSAYGEALAGGEARGR